MNTPQAINLEKYRGYLAILADLQLDDRIRGKVCAEDIAQQAMVKAQRGLPELRSLDTCSVLAWLRTILKHELADTCKYYYRDIRDVGREVEGVDASAADLEAWLDADLTSPSQAASKNEELLRLTKALLALQEEMRQIVVMKHLKNMQVRDIASATGRTPASVAGLLRRGLARLRAILESSH